MATRAAAIVFILFTMAIGCFAQSNERMTYSAIAIEYIGESDHLVTTVLISNSEAGAERYRRMVLEPSEMKLASAHVISMPLFNDVIAKMDEFESARQGPVVSPQFSAVQVSIITPERSSCLIYGATEALLLLEVVQEAVAKDESLSRDIGRFQNWVSQYRRR